MKEFAPTVDKSAILLITATKILYFPRSHLARYGFLTNFAANL